MKTERKRARRAAAQAIGAECGLSGRATLAHLDKLEEVGLIVPIDDYTGGVLLPDLAAVVKYW